MTERSSEQFSKTARAYLESAVHASGDDLRALVAAAREAGGERLLDVGTNVGHTLRAVAGLVRRAVGADVASDALRLSRSVTGAANVSFVEADAASLPFADGAFDIVTCRLAAHHFPDPVRAFAEIARVLRSGGTLLLSDNYAPDDPVLDRWINELERLRDASHVRERTLDQERALLERAGLHPRVAGRYRTPLRTEEWLARSQTPPERASRARELLRAASPAAHAAFRVADDGSAFELDKALIVARR